MERASNPQLPHSLSRSLQLSLLYLICILYIYICIHSRLDHWKASRHSKGHEFKGARCSWSHKFLNITKSFEDVAAYLLYCSIMQCLASVHDSVFNCIRMNRVCIYISQPLNAPQHVSPVLLIHLCFKRLAREFLDANHKTHAALPATEQSSR